MKLGEALQLRSDNYKKIEQLKARAVGAAIVQEGEKPSDNPVELVREIERISTEALDLVQRINRTNVAAKLRSGKPLVDALAERDAYLGLRAHLEAVAQSASNRSDRYIRSELRLVRTIEPSTLRKRVDELSQKYRELDVAIQEANWNTELL